MAAQPIGTIAVHSALNDGTAVCLRTITPDDEDRIREGIATLSAESRYLRFFSGMAMQPDPVIERLADVDGHNHIAWGALCTECEGTPAIGAVHAVRYGGGSGAGEFSVAVLDAFQGLGLARMMTAALLVHCLAEGMGRLDVHILSENRAAKQLVKSLGGVSTQASGGIADYALDVAGAIAALRQDKDARGVQDVLRALGG